MPSASKYFAIADECDHEEGNIFYAMNDQRCISIHYNNYLVKLLFAKKDEKMLLPKVRINFNVVYSDQLNMNLFTSELRIAISSLFCCVLNCYEVQFKNIEKETLFDSCLYMYYLSHHHSLGTYQVES